MQIREVLGSVQEDLPLVSEPFRYLAEKVGLDEGRVLTVLQQLKEEGVIRQISPIYDTKRSGYDSALVAFRVDPDRLDLVAERVSSHPGVSHNYEREHTFNLWFTIAVPPDGTLTLEDTVEILASTPGVREFRIMRSLRTFKIGVRLNFRSLFEREEVKPPPEEGPVHLSPLEKEVIRNTQEDLPLVPRPFALLASRMDMDEETLLWVLAGLKRKGVMRRFSAILRHRKAGFKANGMVVWKVPEERVEEVGRFLSSFRCVSHCYERYEWDYNLFSMVHGRSREEVEGFVAKVGDHLGLKDRVILFSRREFLKRRVKIFSEDFYEWERREFGSVTHKGEDSEGSG